MIPQAELDRFFLTLAEAMHCAEQGRKSKGYFLLRAGWDEAGRSPESWSGEAEELWARGMQRFQQRFPAEWYPSVQPSPQPARDCATTRFYFRPALGG